MEQIFHLKGIRGKGERKRLQRLKLKVTDEGKKDFNSARTKVSESTTLSWNFRDYRTCGMLMKAPRWLSRGGEGLIWR